MPHLLEITVSSFLRQLGHGLSKRRHFLALCTFCFVFYLWLLKTDHWISEDGMEKCYIYWGLFGEGRVSLSGRCLVKLELYTVRL